MLQEVFPRQRKGECVAPCAQSVPRHVHLAVERRGLIAVARLHGHADQRRDARAGADHLHDGDLFGVEPLRREAREHVVGKAARRQPAFAQCLVTVGAERHLALLAEGARWHVFGVCGAAVIFGAAQ